MNFPKNSGRLVLRTNPAVYVQIRHEFARRQIYGFRNIFVTSMRGCVIVWVWGEVRIRRGFWEELWRVQL
ncbi:hypothetical protein CPL00146S_CDS0170 [Escherichia phage SmurfNell]